MGATLRKVLTSRRVGRTLGLGVRIGFGGVVGAVERCGPLSIGMPHLTVLEGFGKLAAHCRITRHADLLHGVW